MSVGGDDISLRFTKHTTRDQRARTRHTKLLLRTLGRAAKIERDDPDAYKVLYADHTRREVWLGKCIVASWKRGEDGQENFSINKQAIDEQARVLKLTISAEDIISTFNADISS